MNTARLNRANWRIDHKILIAAKPQPIKGETTKSTKYTKVRRYLVPLVPFVVSPEILSGKQDSGS
jgi:hypothetical protein